MLGSAALAYGRKTEKLGLNADELKGEVVDGEPCIKLHGNVVFKMEEATITAVNALYYENKQLFEANEHVKIVQLIGQLNP